MSTLLVTLAIVLAFLIGVTLTAATVAVTAMSKNTRKD